MLISSRVRVASLSPWFVYLGLVDKGTRLREEENARVKVEGFMCRVYNRGLVCRGL